MNMKINKIQNTVSCKATQTDKQKPEFIDKFTDAIKNPRDIDDCIAVPRGIFKAYLLIMSGTGVIAIANLLPEQIKKLKLGGTKKALCIAGWVLNTLSAWFFAKGFAVNGLSKTHNRDEFKKQNA